MCPTCSTSYCGFPELTVDIKGPNGVTYTGILLDEYDFEEAMALYYFNGPDFDTEREVWLTVEEATDEEILEALMWGPRNFEQE